MAAEAKSTRTGPAKAFREGKGYAIRFMCKGKREYLSGYATEAKAEKAAEDHRRAVDKTGLPDGDGPDHTNLAQAIQKFALSRLPYCKGARQDANRLNSYLRAAGQDTLQVEELSEEESRKQSTSQAVKQSKKQDKVHNRVTLVMHTPQRRVVNSLKSHRQGLSQKHSRSQGLKRELARMRYADVTARHVQQLVDAMLDEGYAASTVHNEIAQLSRVFDYAQRVWYWRPEARNPAKNLMKPTIDNARDRVLTRDEWGQLCVEIDRYDNPHLAPLIAMLLETAMRISEPLLRARWDDVQWERCVLALTDAKGGKRDVPLSPDAMKILRLLHKHRSGERLFPTTYEAIKKGWRVCCDRAGIKDLHIHDLRHTAATRLALEFNGNIFVLKVCTGHKTTSQLERYVNIKADDVVTKLHGRAPGGNSAAGLRDALPPSLAAAMRKDADDAAFGSNVVHAQFGRRRAA